MLKYKLYLKDILNAINKIENSLKDINEISKNEDKLDMTLMRLQVIGESSKKLPKSLKDKHNKVNWEKIYLMRNIISHAYFNVDPETIIDIIKEEIPKLKNEIQQMLNEIK